MNLLDFSKSTPQRSIRIIMHSEAFLITCLGAFLFSNAIAAAPARAHGDDSPNGDISSGDSSVDQSGSAANQYGSSGGLNDNSITGGRGSGTGKKASNTDDDSPGDGKNVYSSESGEDLLNDSTQIGYSGDKNLHQGDRPLGPGKKTSDSKAYESNDGGDDDDDNDYDNHDDEGDGEDDDDTEGVPNHGVQQKPPPTVFPSKRHPTLALDPVPTMTPTTPRPDLLILPETTVAVETPTLNAGMVVMREVKEGLTEKMRMMSKVEAALPRRALTPWQALTAPTISMRQAGIHPPLWSLSTRMKNAQKLCAQTPMDRSRAHWCFQNSMLSE